MLNTKHIYIFLTIPRVILADLLLIGGIDEAIYNNSDDSVKDPDYIPEKDLDYNPENDLGLNNEENDNLFSGKLLLIFQL